MFKKSSFVIVVSGTSMESYVQREQNLMQKLLDCLNGFDHFEEANNFFLFNKTVNCNRIKHIFLEWFYAFVAIV